MATVQLDAATIDRLIGWKAIGAFLGCDARTAKRWEGSRRMPVYRVPGAGAPTVWADRAELRAWLVGAPPEQFTEPPAEALAGAAPPDALSPPHRWRQRALALLAATTIAGVAAGTILAGRAVTAPATATVVAPRAEPYRDDAAARQLYLAARFELGTRSAQGIDAARRDFQALTLRFPDRAAGYSGLAEAHLMSREFGAVPDAVAFPRAARAARTALALDPGLADAWLNHAFVAFWWQGDTAGGLAAFRQAVARAPEMAKAHHWYATAALAIGDVATARREIAVARGLDPNSHAIVADAAFVELSAGNVAEAEPALRQLVAVDPEFVAAHRYLALLDLITARDADYLREAATTATLMGRPRQLAGVDRAAARWRAGGRPAMLAQLTTEAIAAEARGEGCLADIIGLAALAGDRAGVDHWLGVTRARDAKQVRFLVAEPMLLDWRRDAAHRAAITPS